MASVEITNPTVKGYTLTVKKPKARGIDVEGLLAEETDRLKAPLQEALPEVRVAEMTAPPGGRAQRTHRRANGLPDRLLRPGADDPDW